MNFNDSLQPLIGDAIQEENQSERQKCAVHFSTLKYFYFPGRSPMNASFIQ